MAAPTNPIFERLTLHRRWPSLRTTCWIGGILLIYNLASMFVAYPDIVAGSIPNWLSSLTIPSMIAVLIGWALLVFCPVIVGIYAVVLTARDGRSEAAKLVNLTNIEQHDLERGYLLATLFRLRFPLALAVGCG